MKDKCVHISSQRTKKAMSSVTPQEGGGEGHWTYTLFVNHPELFLPMRESGKEKAIAQIEGLCKIFNELGVSEGAKILDLAYGIGRHSIPFAKKGYEVVGYELSPEYIKYAKKWVEMEEERGGLNENKIRFYQGDIRNAAEVLSAAGETGFNAIINMETSHGYFGEEENNRTFKELIGIATQKSVFVIEGVSSDGLVRKFQPCGISAISDKIVLHQIRKLNMETSEMENDWEFYEKMHDSGNLKLLLSLSVIHRVYTLHELKNALENAGWKYCLSYSNPITLEPLGIDSFNMLIVSQKS